LNSAARPKPLLAADEEAVMRDLVENALTRTKAD
jgi:hypothetical protein